MRRLHPRGATSVAVALLFVLIGVMRYASDLDRDYWRRFEGTPLRYVIRAPTDGSVAGGLNVQFFKLLSIPCAMALVYLWFRRRFGTLREGAFRFGQTWVKVLWISTFFVAFFLIEVEKQFNVLGTKTARMYEGETFLMNNVVHVLSAGLAWLLVSRLSFDPVFADQVVTRPALPGKSTKTAPPPAPPGDAPADPRP
jgi:hypothetical protein